VIVIFWTWGSVIRPKVSLLVHRYVGIPVIAKESLENIKLKKDEYPLQEFTTNELLFTYHTIGIISAGVVEGLLFTGLLFPMRKYFIYSLDNTKDFIHDKGSIITKFISLTLMIPALIILLTKYTLSDISEDYKFQKMSSGVLVQYISIPIVLFTLQSLFKIPVIDTVSKFNTIGLLLLLLIPIILSYVTVYILKYRGSYYINKDANASRLLESYMSEKADASVCDESQNKYKYIVAAVTLIFCVICFGPLLFVGKFQPLNGFLLLAILMTIVKSIYSVQSNTEEYNILNPRRKNKHGDLDLDTTTSILTVMGGILISITLLLLFRKVR